MKKLFMALTAIAAGLATGGAAGFGVQTFAPGMGRHAAAPAPPVFVPVNRMLAPLVDREGRLTGYVRFELALEVPADRAEYVRARLPLLMHAVNLRTFRTPMAAGRDGQLPDIDMMRRVVTAAAPEAFGKGAVRRVSITQAVPA
ncbi:MAG: hypothetical protein QM688_08620 [Sphingomonas bacterium]